MSRIFIASWRLVLLSIGILLGFGAVLARLYVLHVVDSDELRAFVESSRKMRIPVEARRGDIIDARGNLLAATRPRVVVGLDPQVADFEANESWRRLAHLLETPLKMLEAKVEGKLRTTADGGKRAVRWVRLAEVGPEQYDIIRELGLDGVYGNLHYERYYPGGPLAAHVLGYVNKEGTPVLGVEHYMDYFLRGQDGWKETEGDAHRREMAQFRNREIEAADGYEVQLTLDMVVQSYVEEAIAKLVAEYEPAGVSVIVSDPLTGDILGMGNYPSFDPNTFWDFPLGNQRNRAVSDLYEPGSTFKIVPVAAALEEKLVQPNTMIDCAAPVAEYNGRTIRLPSDHHDLGTLSVAEVVAKSSNRGVAQLGLLLGENRLHDYAADFGFGKPVRWGPIGEARGTLHPVSEWDGLTISRLPAGYAVNATPLQVHFAMSAMANGGLLMEPRLISRIIDGSGSTVLDFPVRERQRVVSEMTARTVSALLAEVPTANGTARRAAIPGYEVAGKTGTSRKIIEGRYSQRHHYASFSGFFPARAPRFAITVMVDDAQLSGVAYGGAVAAPAFREIGERLIDYYALSPVPDDTEQPVFAFLRKD